MNLVYIDNYDFDFAAENGELFKLERITPEQRREIERKAPFVEFLTSQAQYAPEVKHTCVWIPLWAMRNTTVFEWLFLGEFSWSWDYEGMHQAVLFS